MLAGAQNAVVVARGTLVRTPWIARAVQCMVAAAAILAGEKIGCAQQPAAPVTADRFEFFEKRIRPVLVKYCYECHSADARSLRGGLHLDTRSGIRAGGDSGPAVVPGKPQESVLVESLKYESYEMPPSGQLSPEVIADFETWIRDGAPDPRDGTVVRKSGLDLTAGREFWSFRPVSDPPVPTPENAAWARTDIDRFLLARMEQSGLTPAADADRRTLARRVWFNLIGLPPPPQELEDFLSDTSDEALERLIDRLLQSPQFGERWGRHWLDVARYADSTGGGRSALFGTSWRYRDYVVEAFNADLPFDTFIIEQIAGDLLPQTDPATTRRQLTATGFLAMGPTNYELQDKRQLRMDVVDEQIDTIGRAFLGMTLGCARCHDHKFDPIPTSDYYALAGIFRSTRTLIDGNVSTWVKRTLPPAETDAAEASARAKRIGQLQQQIKRTQRLLTRLRSQLPVVTVDDNEAALTGRWTTSTSVQPFAGESYRHASGGRSTARYEFAISESGTYDVRAKWCAHGNRSPDALFRVIHADGVAEKRVNQKKPPRSADGFASLGRFSFNAEAPGVVVLTTEGTTGVVIADAVQFQRLDVEAGALAETTTRVARETKALANLRKQLAELRKASSEGGEVMSVEEEKEPADYHICIRGNLRNPGEAVPRGVLTVASVQPVRIPEGVSGRRELAEWIASSTNPLTARVAVNRVWHHLFGVGLVRTVDNFGVPGERPSHPELLDHLAARFAEGGWSVKSLIREIMLSRAWQLEAMATAEHDRLDPENRLLAHHRRRRLDAEAIRDAILSLSGELELSRGGPTVRDGTKSEYGYVFDENRRSLYLPIFRNRLHGLFSVFDFPDPNRSLGKRSTSTLSTQALYLMNSPFILQRARTAAARLLAEPPQTDGARLDLLFQRALGRKPRELERQRMIRHLSESATRDGLTPLETWTGVCQAVMGCLDFRYVD